VKQPKRKSVERFPGLSLKEEEGRTLAATRAGRKRLSIRRWRRIRILELLDKGWTIAQRDYEYVRHGTANHRFSGGLVLHKPVYRDVSRPRDVNA
jgi:hypothetical protein